VFYDNFSTIRLYHVFTVEWTKYPANILKLPFFIFLVFLEKYFKFLKPLDLIGLGDGTVNPEF